MTLVNQSSVLGDLIPNVYIKKITLETSGDENTDRNPHIDHEREPGKVRNPETGKVESVILMPDYFKKSAEAEAMVVNIDFVIKEKLNNSLVSSWFSEQDFIEYFNVKVLQVESPRRLQNLLLSSFKIKDAKKYKIISIKEEIGKTALNQLVFSIDDDGNKVYDISFRTKFTVKNSNPKFLAYVAIAYLDLKSLAAKYKLDLKESDEEEFQSRPAAELVIEDYDIAGKSYQFVDDTGAIWAGPVYQTDEGAWFAGFDNQGSALEVKEVINSKIQDFRSVKELERLQLDLSVIENRLFSPGQNIKLLTNDVLGVEHLRKNIGPFSLSRDSDGNCRFLFGVDFLSLVRDNVVLGPMLRNDNKELLEFVKIRHITVSRVRIANDNKGIPDENGLTTFHKEDFPEPIITSGEKKGNTLFTRSTPKGSLRELKLFQENDSGMRFFTGIDKTMKDITYGAYKYEATFEIEDRTREFFTGELDELIQATNGLNQFLQTASLLDNFDPMLNRFKDSFITAQEKMYVSQPEKAPWYTAISTYSKIMSVMYEKFDDKVIDFLYTIVHPRTSNPNGIRTMIQLIEKLAQELASLLKTTISGKAGKWVPGQAQQSRDYVATRGKVAVKSFTVSGYSQDFFDSDIPKAVGFDFLSIKETDTENNDDGLAVVSNLDFETRVEKETLKYFKGLTPNINLATEATTYTQDDKIENSKYSYLTPSKISLGAQNKMSLLGQGKKLFDPEEYKKLVPNMVAFKALKNSPQIPLGGFNVSEDSKMTISEQSAVHAMTNLLSQSGLIIETEADTKKQVAENDLGSSETPRTSDSRDVLGKDSKFLAEDTLVENKGNLNPEESVRQYPPKDAAAVFSALSIPILDDGANEPLIQSKARQERKKRFNTLASFDLQNPANLLDAAGDNPILKASVESGKGFKDGIRKPDYIKALPNQIKSVLLAGISSGEITKNWYDGVKMGVDPLDIPDNNFMFKLNYKVINRIEMLVGFDYNDTGLLLINKPRWKRLTEALFDEVAKGTNALCRLTPYTNREMGIVVPTSLDLNVYNQYFILSPEKKILDSIIPVITATKFGDIKDKIDAKAKEKLNEIEYYSNLPLTTNKKAPTMPQISELTAEKVESNRKNRFVAGNTSELEDKFDASTPTNKRGSF